MYETKSIPNTFLENTKIVNEATNYFKTNKDISEMNTLYNKNINYFSFNKTDNNNFQSNALNINKNSFETNKLNKQKKFGWKNIMNLNYKEIAKDENILDNPLIKNILNSDINENEIQNIPENYLVNLIHTLQGLANEAIKNKNDLEIENKKLNQDLEEMKTNNEYLNQTNIKMNQKLLNLNKYNMNNYIYNIFNQNTPYININSINKKKYYCHICTNKKFKSQFYLEEHIKRRHPHYQDKIQIKKNSKDKDKENKEFLQNKLNQINKYFDYLINKFIKKIQYIKINEKLNSLQNIYDMMQLNRDVKITNINKTNISKEKDIINKSITKINKNKESFNENENNENEIDDNITIDIMEDSLQKKHEEELKKLSKTKDLLEKRHGNFIYQYWLTKKEIQFLTIRKNFAINPEEEEDQSNYQRRRKKLQTLKIESKLKVKNTMEEKQYNDGTKIEINEENNMKEKLDDKNQEKNILKQNKENIIDNNDNNNININIISDEINNKINKEQKDILYSNTKKEEESVKSTKQKFKLKSEKLITFSDEEIEEEEDKEYQTLKKFYNDFRSREFKISSEHKYHKKTVAPDDYINNNQEKINDALDEKINKKMKKINFEGKTNKEMKADMMQIYYATIDTNYLYGDRYLYTYMNIGNFVNIKDIISDAYNTNFYAEDSFFEKVKYNIQNNPENSEGNISGNDQFINVSFGNIKAN